MNQLQCPACGSMDLELQKEQIKLSQPYGGERYIEIENHQCKVCDFCGDIQNQNDSIIEVEIQNLRTHAYHVIVDHLENEPELKIRLIDIERILGLPFGSLGKNKPGQGSSDPLILALLSFIKRFPWLINVAEEKFDFKKSHDIFMNAAYDEAQDEFYS